MIDKATESVNDYIDLNNVYQVICVDGNNPIMHTHCKEQTIEEMSVRLNIPKDRIHKTVQVNFYIHDITQEERLYIKSQTLGELKGKVKKFDSKVL